MNRKFPRVPPALIAAAVIILLARIALPHVVESEVNKRLHDMGDYRGKVEDVDLALIAGAYSLEGLSVHKLEADVAQEFVTLKRLDLSIQWGALFKGRVVGEAVMVKPQVHFVQGEGEQQTQLGRGVNWPDQVRNLFPFELNRVQVEDGLLTFQAPGITAPESLTLHDLQAEILNLENVQDIDKAAFADVRAAGRVMGMAPLGLEGAIDPNEELPAFDLNIRLEGVRLPRVNPWLREYLKVDAEAGEFAMYSELATADGQFEGYVKPFLEEPVIFRLDEPAPTPFHKVWEALVQIAAEIFENPKEDQVATEIPMSGALENPDSDALAAFVNLARNAFVAAFSRSINDSISLKRIRDPEEDQASA
ncbi:MAG: DUF748 domain-containing protein [Xanthomonadales bacterium]|nr:DUF748 domain-containing protein [Xanthomonadales bacterium]